MFRTTISSLAAASLYLASSFAMADTASCPESDPTNLYDRDISVETDTGVAVDCYAFGSGNISGAIDPIDFSDPTTISPGVVQGPAGVGSDEWYLIEASNGGTGTLISYDAALGEIYLDGSLAGLDLGLLIKVGGGTGDPDWAFFALEYDAIVEFLISGGTGGGISHASIYCRGDCEFRDVPEPATLGLLGLGLAGLGFGVRRRKI